MGEPIGQAPADMRAALDSMQQLNPDMRELVRDYWIARMVPEIYGDNVDDDKTGLKGEVRNLRRWVMTGGGCALALQVIQTFGLADVIKHGLIALLGGK